MSKKLQIILLFFLIASLIFTSFYIRDFRIDASSDSLVSQNDEDFKYFSYYQDLFPTKNSLVIAIKSNSKIDRILIEEIEKISKKLSDLPEVYSVFNINKAPILLLNKTNLLDLANDNYETIIDTNLAIKDVLNEFAKSPIYSDQIINENKSINFTKLIFDKNVSKISIIGVGMVTTPGVTFRMFQALANQKINIQVISTSEIKISVLVNKINVKKAISVLHKEFKLEK